MIDVIRANAGEIEHLTGVHVRDRTSASQSPRSEHRLACRNGKLQAYFDLVAPVMANGDKRSLVFGCGWRFFYRNWLRLGRRRVGNLVAFGLLIAFVID